MRLCLLALLWPGTQPWGHLGCSHTQQLMLRLPACPGELLNLGWCNQTLVADGLHVGWQTCTEDHRQLEPSSLLHPWTLSSPESPVTRPACLENNSVTKPALPSLCLMRSHFDVPRDHGKPFKLRFWE